MVRCDAPPPPKRPSRRPQQPPPPPLEEEEYRQEQQQQQQLHSTSAGSRKRGRDFDENSAAASAASFELTSSAAGEVDVPVLIMPCKRPQKQQRQGKGAQRRAQQAMNRKYESAFASIIQISESQPDVVQLDGEGRLVATGFRSQTQVRLGDDAVTFTPPARNADPATVLNFNVSRASGPSTPLQFSLSLADSSSEPEASSELGSLFQNFIERKLPSIVDKLDDVLDDHTLSGLGLLRVQQKFLKLQDHSVAAKCAVVDMDNSGSTSHMAELDRAMSPEDEVVVRSVNEDVSIRIGIPHFGSSQYFSALPRRRPVMLQDLFKTVVKALELSMSENDAARDITAALICGDAWIEWQNIALVNDANMQRVSFHDTQKDFYLRLATERASRAVARLLGKQAPNLPLDTVSPLSNSAGRYVLTRVAMPSTPEWRPRFGFLHGGARHYTQACAQVILHDGCPPEFRNEPTVPLLLSEYKRAHRMTCWSSKYGYEKHHAEIIFPSDDLDAKRLHGDLLRDRETMFCSLSGTRELEMQVIAEKVEPGQALLFRVWATKINNDFALLRELLPERTKRLICVLDIDDTLLQLQKPDREHPDRLIPVVRDGASTIDVTEAFHHPPVRRLAVLAPGLERMLSELSSLYTFVICTAGNLLYADVVSRELDKAVVKYRRLHNQPVLGRPIITRAWSFQREALRYVEALCSRDIESCVAEKGPNIRQNIALKEAIFRALQAQLPQSTIDAVIAQASNKQAKVANRCSFRASDCYAKALDRMLPCLGEDGYAARACVILDDSLDVWDPRDQQRIVNVSLDEAHAPNVDAFYPALYKMATEFFRAYPNGHGDIIRFICPAVTRCTPPASPHHV